MVPTLRLSSRQRQKQNSLFVSFFVSKACIAFLRLVNVCIWLSSFAEKLILIGKFFTFWANFSLQPNFVNYSPFLSYLAKQTVCFRGFTFPRSQSDVLYTLFCYPLPPKSVRASWDLSIGQAWISLLDLSFVFFFCLFLCFFFCFFLRPIFERYAPPPLVSRPPPPNREAVRKFDNWRQDWAAQQELLERCGIDTTGFFDTSSHAPIATLASPPPICRQGFFLKG